MISAILNRMLADEPLLKHRLQLLAGHSIAIDIGIRFCWQIMPTGRLMASRKKADATLYVDLSALPLLLTDRMAFNRTVRIDGDETLGITFAQIITQLRWDTEEALSRLIGDVLAHRIIQVGQPFFTWPRQSLKSLLQSMAEYYQQESKDIVGRVELIKFYQEVDALRADTDRLEKRISHLLTTAKFS